ncbi:MAG: PAS domain S-box protein [Pseudomonadota bacterium]
MTAILSAISFLHVKSTNEHLIQKVNTIQNTLEISKKLRETVINRVLTIQAALINEDPFQQDELLMEHSELGGHFLALYDKFNQRILNVKSLHDVENLQQTVSISASLQNKLKKLIYDNKLAKARVLASKTEVVKAKNNILVILDKIQAHYTLLLKQAIGKTNSTTMQGFQLIIIAVIVTLLTILFFASQIVNIICLTDKKLLEEIEKRNNIQEKLILYQQALKKTLKEKSTALKLSEVRNKAIVDHAPIAIVSMGLDGKIISFNPEAEKIFDYCQEDIIGKPLTMLMPEEFHKAHNDGLKRYLNDGSASILNKAIDIKALHKNGKAFPVDLLVSIVRAEKEVFFTGMMLNTTEQKNMQAELLQARKLESVGQLAAGIAHEINTPLQYINDNTHFLKGAFADIQQVYTAHNKLLLLKKELPENVLSENKQKQQDSILGEIETLKEEFDLDYLLEEIPITFEQTIEGLISITEIISAMKSFSHPGKKDRVAVNLNDIINNSQIISRNEWKYFADLHIELDETLSDIKLYPDLIGQVLLNLIVNAAHAIKEHLEESKKGMIKIISSQQKGYQQVEIIDNGGGINDAIKDKIFDPFFTTKDVGKGTGQGLSMAYSVITEKHKGKLAFENNAMGGTTFFIKLPSS